VRQPDGLAAGRQLAANELFDSGVGKLGRTPAAEKEEDEDSLSSLHLTVSRADR
jgi:hypothetical protein